MDTSQYTAAIAYEPMQSEVDFRSSLFPITVPKKTISLPQGRTEDPYAWAQRLTTELEGERVVILVPGTAFDALGTRHGRGGGWYDRFLSSVPPTWLRIGVTTEAHFSQTPLTREVWDEPMDYVVYDDVIVTCPKR